MTKDEVLRLALEALIGARAFLESDAPVEIWGVNDKAIDAIKEALAQPEQEPCCYGGIAHDCRADENCRIVKRMKTAHGIKENT